jgi:hypothetical protein
MPRWKLEKLDPRKLYRFCDIARIANISVVTLYLWRRDGRLVVCSGKPSMTSGQRVIEAAQGRPLP